MYFYILKPKSLSGILLYGTPRKSMVTYEYIRFAFHFDECSFFGKFPYKSVLCYLKADIKKKNDIFDCKCVINIF